jgi:beta-lactamase class C
MRQPFVYQAVQPIVEEIRHTQAVPGIVIAVEQYGYPLAYLVVGTDAAGQPLTADSLFPVASITKLATALAVLRLVASGAMALDDPLAGYLPEAAAAVDGVTLRSLLSHTAGLPPDVAPETAPYTAQLDWPALARACLATPLVRPPQTRVSYSNTGYGLLAIVVERITGYPFNAAVTDLVLQPLEIEGYLGVEPPRQPAQIMGELGRHAGTALEPYNSAFWRSLALPWGGLVTTAAGALGLVRAFTGPAGFLPDDLLAEAISDQTGGLAGGMGGVGRGAHYAWGLGPELRGDKRPHFAPAEASPMSFGHAGASGCLAWFEPVAGVAWAILGTRTFERWWRQWPTIGAAILNTLANKKLEG